MQKSVGPFTIISKLGQGGMAEVFKATRSGAMGFSKFNALKRIIPPLADQPHFLSMLTKEAKIQSGLNHPNLVGVIDFQKYDQEYWLILEYVDGLDLKSLMRLCRKHEIKIDPQAFLYIICEVLKGLEYVHQKKDDAHNDLCIIHRDISPQNILISREGIVKLSDFGIARSAQIDDKTTTNLLKGKIPYLSPEQVLLKPLDHRSDLFSVGTVLYELVFDVNPFLGTSEFETMSNIQNGTLPDIHPLPNPKLITIIEKSLNPNRELRYQNATQMRDDIIAILSDLWKDQGDKQLRLFFTSVDEKERNNQDKTSSKKTFVWANHTTTQINHYKTASFSLSFFILFILIFFAATKFNQVIKPSSTHLENQLSNQDANHDVFAPANKPTATPSPIPIPYGMGAVKVIAPKQSKIFVNGTLKGKAPLEYVFLKPGKYLILIKLTNGKTQMRTIYLKAQQNRTVYWLKE